MSAGMPSNPPKVLQERPTDHVQQLERLDCSAAEERGAPGLHHRLLPRSQWLPERSSSLPHARCLRCRYPAGSRLGLVCRTRHQKTKTVHTSKTDTKRPPVAGSRPSYPAALKSPLGAATSRS